MVGNSFLSIINTTNRVSNEPIIITSYYDVTPEHICKLIVSTFLKCELNLTINVFCHRRSAVFSIAVCRPTA